MRSSHTRGVSPVQYDSATGLITAIGLLLGGGGLAYVVTHPEPLLTWAIEIALVSVPAAALVYGGYWIAAHSVPQEDRWNIAKWSVAGLILAAVILGGYVRAEQIGGGVVINPELLILLGALSGSAIALFAALSNERRHLDRALEASEPGPSIELVADPFSSDAQALGDLVGDTHSWYVVRLLRLAEKPLGVESLAIRIASLEETDPHSVYVDLVHTRFPKLSEKGLIEYDSDVDIVRLGDRIDALATAGNELAEAGTQLAPPEKRN